MGRGGAWEGAGRLCGLLSGFHGNLQVCTRSHVSAAEKLQELSVPRESWRQLTSRALSPERGREEELRFEPCPRSPGPWVLARGGRGGHRT